MATFMNYWQATLCTTLLFASPCASFETKQQLVGRLFANYDRQVIPRTLGTVDVTVGIHLGTLLNVDAVNNKFEMKGSVILKWRDDFMQWNASDSGHSELQIPSADLWLPDVAIANALEQTSADFFVDPDSRAKVVVLASGDCTVAVPLHLVLTCRYQLAKFPFDSQMCPIYLTATHLDDDFQDLTGSAEAEMTRIFDGVPPEWKTVDISILNVKKTTREEYVDQEFPMVTYSVEIKRTATIYYLVYSYIPVTCTTLISFFCFVLPPRVGERMGIGATGMLTIVAIMFVTAGKLPVQKDSTSLDIFYQTSIMFNFLVVIECTLVGYLSDIGRGKRSAASKKFRYELGHQIDQFCTIVFPAVYAWYVFATYSVAGGSEWSDAVDPSGAKTPGLTGQASQYYNVDGNSTSGKLSVMSDKASGVSAAGMAMPELQVVLIPLITMLLNKIF